ncbi:MAG: glycosyltransferase family 4 protein [Nanoarchaeota archaeon]|nr:glycosyltransferase family 4 protein [Nanoarchaeota archaeon]
MKILEITEFSSGHCGVWTRVLAESKELVKLGNDVTIFSSNIEKGTCKEVKSEENIGKIKIKRFKTSWLDKITSLFTKNVRMWFLIDWPFKEKVIEEQKQYNPDIIITHLLHPHSSNILHSINYFKKINPKLKVIIVPHAPFNIDRGFMLNLLTKIWRFGALRNKLNNFDKIIAITQWEMPYLKELGVKENKIVYIPNGIPDEFFKQKQVKETKDVLFLGRIAPVKDLETLILAAKLLPSIDFSIVGPAEEDYFKKIKGLINKNNISNVKIYPQINNINKKIEFIDKHKIFVLPSKREAMPQVLLEALSRGKIVISSNTDGGKEIIKDGKTGFLFDIGNYEQLANLIDRCLKENMSNIEKNAKKDAEKYKWSVLIKKIENAYGLG